MANYGLCSTENSCDMCGAPTRNCLSKEKRCVALCDHCAANLFPFESDKIFEVLTNVGTSTIHAHQAIQAKSQT